MAQQFSIGALNDLLTGELSDQSCSNSIVYGLADDSRNCKRGDIFVAIAGSHANGLEYLDQAIRNGAAAVVAQQSLSLKIPSIKVKNARAALSKLAATFFSNPARNLLTIGITGTNGKTTTNWMIYNLLQSATGSCMRIGTLGVEVAGKPEASESLTTPGAIELHRLLANASAQSVQSVVLEASSHALEQQRCDDLDFNLAVFTNLTQDHLDYHTTLEKYFGAKRRLFELLLKSPKTQRCAVINISDSAGLKLFEEFSDSINSISFGWGSQAQVQIVEHGGFKLRYSGETYDLPDSFLGKHNAENMAATFAVGIALGLDANSVIREIANCPQVPGRLERVGGSNIEVLVDFAHTPDALENVLRSLRPSCKGKLVVVFGCGGDRDRGKRPKMGAIAARLADRVIVTSDNPRTEDADSIIAQILQGCSGAYCESEVDRRKAIGRAIMNAAESDVVLIAGKGHEEYQIVGSQKLPFSDRTVALEALAKRGTKT